MNPTAKAGGLSLALPRQSRGIRDDWLHDIQPTDSRFTTTGMVRSRDIASAIQVGIEMKTAFPTLEYALRTAVVAGDVSAAATSLRSVSRVNRNYPTTPFLGFVPDKSLDLSERPGVYSALGRTSPFRLHPLTDVLEVFQNNRSSRLDRLNDLPGEHMIAVAAEASLPLPHPFEMTSGRLCTLLLQRPLEVEQPPFDCLPRFFAQEAVGAQYGRTCDAQIDADNLIGRRNVGCGDAHNNVQA